MAIIKHVKIDTNKYNIIARDLTPNYPEDIYLYKMKNKYILSDRLLVKMKSLSINNRDELGGILKYDNNYIKDIILFNGDANKINLDLGKDTQTLFHTHPFTGNKYEPPSILDIISYLANVIKYIADLILDLNKDVEHPLYDPIVIQNCMVFSEEGVYVYYISHPLIKKIVEKIVNLDINSIEKLIEEIEIGYANELFRFNKYYCTVNELNEYLNHLNSLGIMVNFFPYSKKTESYILE